MANDDQKTKLCTSIFKDGATTAEKTIYTQKWIEIIQAIERHKGL